MSVWTIARFRPCNARARTKGIRHAAAIPTAFRCRASRDERNGAMNARPPGPRISPESTAENVEEPVVVLPNWGSTVDPDRYTNTIDGFPEPEPRPRRIGSRRAVPTRPSTEAIRGLVSLGDISNHVRTKGIPRTLEDLKIREGIDGIGLKFLNLGVIVFRTRYSQTACDNVSFRVNRFFFFPPYKVNRRSTGSQS